MSNDERIVALLTDMLVEQKETNKNLQSLRNCSEISSGNIYQEISSKNRFLSPLSSGTKGDSR